MERVEGFCRVHTDTTEGHAYTYAYQEHIIKTEGFSITDSFVDDTVGETDIHVLEIVGYFETIGHATAAIKQITLHPWIGRGYTFTIEADILPNLKDWGSEVTHKCVELPRRHQ